MQLKRLSSFSKGVIMRINLTIAILTLCCVQLSAEVFGQRVTLKVRNIPFLEAIRSIEKQSGYTFFFKMRDIDGLGPVTVSVTDKPITEVLDKLLDNKTYSFQIQEKVIVLTKKPMAADSAGVKAPHLSPRTTIQREIRGRVTDSLKTPIAGVSVFIKGTSMGASTDDQGWFQILAVDGQVLEFRALGYLPREVTIANQALVNVILKEETVGIEEVVAVGYGTQRKVTSTGSISTALGSDIKTSPTTNLTNNLAGRISGLTSITRSGQPGADGSTLLIRGSNTLGNNSPLIVVDGIAGREFARLNPADIESITVLKDASAAIYGAQAANGVILITTKRGKAGSSSISVNIGGGVNQPTRIPDMADAATYATMINELHYYQDESKGRFQQFSEEDIVKYRDGSDPWGHPNTDWFDETLKKFAKQYSADVMITGGSEALKYYISGATKYSDAYYKKSANDYKQYNFRSNLDGKISESVTISVDVAASREEYNNPGYGGGAGGIWRSLMRGMPTRPAYYPTGEPGPDLEFGDQPVVTTTDATGYDRSVWDKLETNARIVVDIPWIDGLSVQGNASYDKHVNLSKRFQKPWILYSWDGGDDHKLTAAMKGITSAQLTESTINRYRSTINLFATYENTFADAHKMKIMLGAERQSGFSDDFSAFRRNYLSTAIDQLFAGADDEYMSNNGSASLYKRANYFGRINYDFHQKYLLEALFRYDGSYIFAPGKQFGFFPGFSAGWRISEEKFWKERVNLFDELKLRASWGQTGNDRINEYQYLSSYAFLPQAYTFGGTNDEKMIYESRIPNPDVTWEVATQRNIGLDGTLLNHKLSFSLDYFMNDRSNILWTRNASVPKSSGLSLPRENIGEVSNNGFEATISYGNREGNFNYHISLNGSYSKNKIDFWDEAPGAPVWQQSTGHPMNTGLYYRAIGIFKDQAAVDAYPHWEGARAGDVIFEDYNQDGIIDGLDRVRDDFNTVPRFTGGMNINLQYGNFDLSLLIQGAAGAKMYIKPESGILGNYYQEFADNRWTPENTGAAYPRSFDGDTQYWRSQANTFWLRSSDYIRLKSVELGYNISMFNGKIGPKTLRLYVNGSNLLLLDKAKIVDPESDPSTISLPYPLQRVLNAGLMLDF